MTRHKRNLCTALALVSLLCACSDYPTSGRLEFRPPQGGPIPAAEIVDIKVELSAVEGEIFELDAAVVKALDAALDDLASLKQDPTSETTDFASKYPDADFSGLAAARQRQTQRRASFEQDVARVVAEREKELAADVDALRARHDALQGNATRFDAVTAQAQSELDAAQTRLDEANARHQEIARRVADATNAIILAERIPVATLDAERLQLSFETRTWPQSKAADRIDCLRAGMWTYSTQSHVIIDERATRRSCSYYRKPTAQLAGDGYEATIRTAFEDVRALDIEARVSAVTAARQVLDNAAIVARNETGIDRTRVDWELKQAASELKRAELVREHGLDAERILGFLGVSAEPQPSNDALAMELGLDPDGENRRIAAQLNPDTLPWEQQHTGNDLHTLAMRYEAELRDAVVRRHIVRTTPLDDTGTFSGLDGGANLIVVVAQAAIAFEHPKRGQRRETATWAELTDLDDETASERAFPGGGVLVQGCDDCPFESGRRLREPDDTTRRAVAAVYRHVNALRRQRGANSG